MKFVIMQLLHPIISSLFVENVLLITLFSSGVYVLPNQQE